jgi:hypothetical protein
VLRPQLSAVAKSGVVKVLVVADDKQLAAFVCMGLMDEDFIFVVSFDGPRMAGPRCKQTSRPRGTRHIASCLRTAA